MQQPTSTADLWASDLDQIARWYIRESGPYEVEYDKKQDRWALLTVTDCTPDEAVHIAEQLDNICPDNWTHARHGNRMIFEILVWQINRNAGE